MKRLFFFLLMLCNVVGHAQFDNLFYPKTLRVDVIHAGNAQYELYALKSLSEEAFWGGSTHNLIDHFNYGRHQAEVFDVASGLLIYSTGYSSLFFEWQTTAEARSMVRSFEETIVIPFPKKPIRLVLSSRDSLEKFNQIMSLEIDPDDYFIQPAKKSTFPIYEVMIHGDAASKVDIVIIPDGFTASEMEHFKQSATTFAESLFQFEPFKSHRNRFNIRAVLAPSLESGVAIPAEDIWPETVLSSNFYTFDSERYCMTTAHHRLRDLAGMVPYDQIYILTNTKKYGGGGIYNFYCLSSAANSASAKIIVHEFGHGFAGLADEYYDNSTSYESFYNTAVEPWEPNITTLVHFDAKWVSLLAEETPVPTPDTDEWEGKTGVYEGGGYMAKGVYRPSRDCLMHTFKKDVFCAACSKAIVDRIDFYTTE